MKKHLSLLLLFCVSILHSQYNEWEWLKGSNGNNQTGTYGTQGVSNAANTPGARENPVSWTDANGMNWIFGGDGIAGTQGYLNDLWKYDPFIGEWTWMRGATTPSSNGVYGILGTPNAINDPGARAGSMAWTDAAGNLWLFGGVGYPFSGGSGYLNDLWKYNVATNQWTWMGGTNATNQYGTYGTQGVPNAANIPGGRWVGGNWYQSGNFLWLHGGEGYASAGPLGQLNDLWRYNITTQQWTWMKGSNLPNQNGIYGTQGIPNAANNPGARVGQASWKDLSGNFYILGGFGFPLSGLQGALNDLWKYDVGTNNWTWLKGANIILQNGTYGTIGVPNAANVPGARFSPVCWIDQSENVWILGGNGLGAVGGMGFLSDQWRYSIATNNWTWIKGSQVIDQNGTYGTLGIPSPANMTGGRKFGCGWAAPCGDLFLFGGNGYPGSGGPNYLNDVWKYNYLAPPVPPINITPIANQTICSGGQATLNAQSQVGGAIAWFATNISTLTLGSGTAFVTPNLTTGTYTYWVEANSCTTSISRNPVTLTVIANPTITVNTGSICAGQSFTIVGSGASSYTYQGGSAVVNPINTTFYNVIGSNTAGCVSSAVVSTVTVYNLPTITVNSGSICSGYNFTMSPSGANSYTYSGGSQVVSPSVTTNYTVTGSDVNGCVSAGVISNITVSSSPVMSVTSGSICIGQSFTMIASGAPTYTFSSGFAVVNPTITTTYSVTGTGTNGCINAIPVISTVNVQQPPTITVSGGSICLGNSFTMMPSGANTYTYSGGTAVVSPTANTTYSITGTSLIGCANYTPVVCDVTVNPVPTITAATSATFMCVGETVTLSASGANTYTWSTGSLLPIAPVSPSVSSTYTVTGMNGFGCSNIAVITISVDMCVGLSSNAEASEDKFDLYPNPSNGEFTFEMKNSGGKIEFINLSGEIILSSEIFEGKNNFDLKNFSKGIYFYRISREEKVFRGKMIVE
jgi:N-acetylneuraminic acid mutarotase